MVKSFDYEFKNQIELKFYRFLRFSQTSISQVLFLQNVMLLDLVSTQLVNVDELAAQLPELPEQQRSRLTQQYELTMEQLVLMVVRHYLHWTFCKKRTGKN